jgi:hypothetical protein
VTKPKTEPQKLPPDVTAGDLEWPPSGTGLTSADYDALGLKADYGPKSPGYSGSLTFYLVGGATARNKEPRWVLTTLPIGKAPRGSGQPDRTYGVTLDGQLCRVGRGPHVLATVTVHLRKDSLPRLQKYVDLWKKGMANAGGTRDRISSRRAQGKQERAAGKHYWRWNT